MRLVKGKKLYIKEKYYLGIKEKMKGESEESGGIAGLCYNFDLISLISSATPPHFNL